MALRPSLSPFLIGNPSSPHTLEFYYDFVCPWSKKSFATLNSILVPLVTTGSLKDKVKIILRLHPQPWHASSMLTHEAVLAVAQVAPQQTLQYIDHLFQVQKNFFDIPASTVSPVDLRNKLIDVGATDSVLTSDQINAAKALLVLNTTDNDGSAIFNGGNAVTNDLKYFIRFGRQNGIHASPTVTWDGLIQDQVSSSWAVAEWTKFFSDSGVPV